MIWIGRSRFSNFCNTDIWSGLKRSLDALEAGSRHSHRESTQASVSCLFSQSIKSSIFGSCSTTFALLIDKYLGINFVFRCFYLDKLFQQIIFFHIKKDPWGKTILETLDMPYSKSHRPDDEMVTIYY